jgi:hypothetical protein
LRRALIAVGIAYIILGLTAPAWADEEQVQVVQFGNGAECTITTGRPFQEVAGSPSALYLSSNFGAQCHESSGIYSIDGFSIDLLHRQSTDLVTWGAYNAHHVKSRNGPGTLSYLPARDKCRTGGAMRYYQQQVVVDVTWRHRMGGIATHTVRTFRLNTLSKMACGASAP